MGRYQHHIPDRLEAHPFTLDGELARRVARTERAVRLLDAPGAAGLASVARFLLRSEAIASSRIEGVAPSPAQVALAELGTHESVRGVSEPAQFAGVRRWVSVFTEAARVAAEQSEGLMAQIVELRVEWAARIAAHRTSSGVRETPRAGSATARLLTMLPEAPVATAGTLRRILGVSFPAASAALEELRQAGILDTRTIERNTTAYVATEALDLVTLAERRLASTKFDTRVTPPNRPVHARPDRGAS